LVKEKKQKRFLSLRIKLLITTAVALLIAALVFITVREVGNFLVWRYYLNEESKQERAEGYISDFQDYVFDNKLSINDSDKISGWSAGRYVDIVLYKDSNLIYAPDWFEKLESDSETTAIETDTESEELSNTEGESTSETEAEAVSGSESVSEGASEIESVSETGSVTDSEEIVETTEILTGEGISNDGWFSGDRGFEEYLNEEARAEYQAALNKLLDGNRELSPIFFVDGTLLITVVDYSEDFMHNLVFAISIIVALLVMGVIMIFNFSATVTRVNRLAHNVKRVESENLELPIALDGNDEITSLAGDVNSMRNTIVDKMTKERQAWEANTGLITAMSHDIRTPLTVMLGYLDLMELQSKDEISSEYIAACKENALRLKTLSDDMFSYFLVFGKNEKLSESIYAQSSDFIEHMIAEHTILLEEQGYRIEREERIPEALVKADQVYFGRVIGNIFSNIAKYADILSPVTISSRIEKEYLVISFANMVASGDRHAESNGIGLKTCARIMEQMNGRFESSLVGDSFTATVYISVKS